VERILLSTLLAQFGNENDWMHYPTKIRAAMTQQKTSPNSFSIFTFFRGQSTGISGQLPNHPLSVGLETSSNKRSPVTTSGRFRLQLQGLEYFMCQIFSFIPTRKLCLRLLDAVSVGGCLAQIQRWSGNEVG
jgi:hypothetical protein